MAPKQSPGDPCLFSSFSMRLCRVKLTVPSSSLGKSCLPFLQALDALVKVGRLQNLAMGFEKG